MITIPQVKAARSLIGWTQQDLARAAGVADSTVADFERGLRKPIPNNLAAIERALADAGLAFQSGGVVLGALASPPLAAWLEDAARAAAAAPLRTMLLIRPDGVHVLAERPAGPTYAAERRTVPWGAFDGAAENPLLRTIDEASRALAEQA